jgi:transcriptional regulator with AAA-type ATPase domain
MQFLIYSKNQTDQSIPTLIDLELSKDNKLSEEITLQGTICLTTGLVYESMRQHFAKAGYIDCGEKGKKIDLKRAFRFDKKRDREKPKLLVFNSSIVGGLKRGLEPFYEKHFTPADPPCLIIIPEDIFRILSIDGIQNKKRKAPNPPSEEQDSLFQLMNIPESSPLMKKLEKAYIGESIEVQHTRALIYRACQSSSAVLILGESGTGKDVIANQIFNNSTTYNKGKLHRVNCSALPESLLEAELFGYKKGIFTGASENKVGLFEAVNGGTIFLDEIGDLSLANQAKLLHAVENKEIRQIGSNESKQVDVRIIAATNRNLDAMMKQGTFREDLYFRICHFRINAYPLREHPNDIPLLAKDHWDKKGQTNPLSPKFLDYLKTYYWPGNVRELNALLNSIIDYFGDIVPTPDHVDAIRRSRQEELHQAISYKTDDPAQLIKIKSQHVLISTQNILRAVKIKMRPVIYEPNDKKCNSMKMEELKRLIIRQAELLDELCFEPSYFIQWDLFKLVAKYRHVLDHTVANWPKSVAQLHAIWNDQIQKLDDDINQGVMEVLWGKIDM